MKISPSLVKMAAEKMKQCLMEQQTETSNETGPVKENVVAPKWRRSRILRFSWMWTPCRIPLYLQGNADSRMTFRRARLSQTQAPLITGSSDPDSTQINTQGSPPRVKKTKDFTNAPSHSLLLDFLTNLLEYRSRCLISPFTLRFAFQ